MSRGHTPKTIGTMPIVEVEYTNSAQAYDIEKHAVGQSIVRVDVSQELIELSNGTVLQFRESHDCCSGFALEGIVTSGDAMNNIITSVKKSSASCEYPSRDAFDLVILSENKQVAAIQVDGTASEGPYVDSLELRVFKPVPVVS